MPPNERPSPCIVVIFGASGDLTKRKLIPSLYDLYVNKQLPERFAVLGVSRTPMTDDEYREHLLEFSRKHAHGLDEAQWREFAKCVHYFAGDSTRSEDYPGLKARLNQLATEHEVDSGNVIFYLSMAPQLYDPTIVNLGAHDMVLEGKAWCSINRHKRSWQRIIIEKPFGHDEASAAHLNRVLGRVFEEESIYRIDHYLGKETVQNLLVFRFANTIFEPLWNRNYIDHVQVTAAETVGVEGRGGYYDSPSGGALRDMIQSHLLQVMGVIAMEPPVSLKADDIRVQKSQVLTAVRIPKMDEVPQIAVKGQYGEGAVNGNKLPAYRAAKGVNPNSQTDTYAAMQLFIDTWRWAGVPFYVRSGKALKRKTTQIVVNFKPAPGLFREQAKLRGGIPPNQIVINIQPDEGIKLRFEGKVPGAGLRTASANLSFDYISEFKSQPPEAYATLLLDAMRGDQTLYKDRIETETTWRIVEPVLDYWEEHPQADLPNYAAGTWGPAAADALLARDGRHWHNF